MDDVTRRKELDAIEFVECTQCTSDFQGRTSRCHACTMNSSSIALLKVEVQRLLILSDKDELIAAAKSLLNMLPEDPNAYEDASQARQISAGATRLRSKLVEKKGTNNYKIFLGS